MAGLVARPGEYELRREPALVHQGALGVEAGVVEMPVDGDQALARLVDHRHSRGQGPLDDGAHGCRVRLARADHPEGGEARVVAQL